MRFTRVFVGALLGWGIAMGPCPAQESVREEAAAARPEDWSQREHSASVREDARVWQLEELALLETKDAAGFQDLLRRNLAARLLWLRERRPLPVDLPLELAER